MPTKGTIERRIRALEKDRKPEDGVLAVYPLPNGEYPSPQDRYWIIGTEEVIGWSELEALRAGRDLLIWDMPTPAPETLQLLQ